MRVICAATLALTLSVPALAQRAVASPKPTEINQVQVFNEQNEKLGDASRIVVNDAGQTEGLVVKLAASGSSESEVVLPLTRIKGGTGDKKVIADATSDELKAMPKLQDAKPDDRAGK